MPADQPGLTDAPLRFGDRAYGTARTNGSPSGSVPLVRQPAAAPGPVVPGPPAEAANGSTNGRKRLGARPALVFERKVGTRRKQAMLKARKVRRIIRHLDPWSVLKVSFIFFLCVYIVSMVALVLLWNLASGAGVIENLESFIEELGAFKTFEFEPDQLLQGTALGGAVLVILATGFTALGSVLFNLISDLVGGVRLTVIEEPLVRPIASPAAKPITSGTPVEASDTVTEPSGVVSGL